MGAALRHRGRRRARTLTQRRAPTTPPRQEEPHAQLRPHRVTAGSFPGHPIPTRSLFTIIDGTITEIHRRYRNFPSFSTLGSPFEFWMEKHHPEITGALFGELTSRDEAIENGRLRAQWAQEWTSAIEPTESVDAD